MDPNIILVFAVISLIVGYPFLAQEDENRKRAAKNGVHYSPMKDSNAFGVSVVIGSAILLVLLGFL
jgi:uncharacterized membrane protein